MLGRGVLNVLVSNLPTKIAQRLLATVTMMPRMHQPRKLQPIHMAPTFRLNKRSAYHHHRIRLGRSSKTSSAGSHVSHAQPADSPADNNYTIATFPQAAIFAPAGGPVDSMP